MSDEIYGHPDRQVEKAKRLVKYAAKKTVKLMLWLIKLTAPVSIPLVLVLALALFAHMLLYGFTRESIEVASLDERTVVAAFFGVTEDEVTDANLRLFDEYKNIAAKWSKGLTDEQKKQVVAHALPWSVLFATDRVINDAAVWEGKENVELKPQEVFEALRPKFKWKESQVVTTTVAFTEQGTEEQVSISTVTLVTKADTFEGNFVYTYEWREEMTESSGSGYVTVRKEVLKEVVPPAEYYLPWKQYLAEARGIIDQITFDHIQELAILFDEEYQFSHALAEGLDYSTYPAIAGSDKWIWPTESARITSPFGPRAYPRPGFHHGVDIGASSRGVSGEPVCSVEGGEIKETGYSVIYGRYIIIRHAGEVYSCYAHLDRINVKAYQKIKKGENIGTMGSTGFSTGVHLHFEVRYGKKPLDPRYYFPQIFSGRSVGIE